MDENFGVRLRDRIHALGPLCVGVDPSRELLESWDRGDNVEAMEFFARATLEAVIGTAAAIKPQVAFFERFGSGGYRVLEQLISDARDADVLVVADAKRGDFAVTNAGYAEAWLAERSTLRVDAVTASPYLGVDALEPLFALARENARGVFVLVATSNKEGRVLQRARTPEGERVEDLVLRTVAGLNQREDGLGSFGVVIGATRDAPEFDLARLGGPYLVPGVGAQGAGAEDVARLFSRCPKDTVLVNVARSILKEGPESAALRDAARRWRDDLNQALA
jgi:orotidine-5'-phosphate decarboxylase